VALIRSKIVESDKKASIGNVFESENRSSQNLPEVCGLTKKRTVESVSEKFLLSCTKVKFKFVFIQIQVLCVICRGRHMVVTRATAALQMRNRLKK